MVDVPQNFARGVLRVVHFAAAQPLGQRADDLLIVFHESERAVLEDRRVGIAVDGADHLRVGDAHDVLAGARDGDRQIELRGDLLAGLTDLPGGGTQPASHAAREAAICAFITSASFCSSVNGSGPPNPRRAEVEALVPDIRLVEADLLDGGSLIRVLDAARADEIYHLAAHRRPSAGPSEMIGATTALGTERLLECIRVAAGASASTTASNAPRIFCAASYEIFGSASRVVDEQTAPSPDCALGIAGAYAYAAAGRYRREFGMPITRGIMFEHVSARCEADSPLRRIARAVADVRRGLECDITIDMAARFDIGMAEDYVAAMHLALRQPLSEDFIIATGETHTLGEFALAAWRRAGVRAGRILDSDREPALGPVASVKKAQIVLGWKPEATFADVVATLVDAELAGAAETRPGTRATRRVTWAAETDIETAADETNPLLQARAA